MTTSSSSRTPGRAATLTRRGGMLACACAVAAGAALALGAGTANAAAACTNTGTGASASASCGVTANVTVDKAISLSLDVGSFNFAPTPAGQTVTATTPVTATVTANTGYNLGVQAAAAQMTGPGGGTIPIGQMSVRDHTGPGAWAALSNTGSALVRTSGVKSAVGGDAIQQDYQLVIPATTSPDTYSVTLNYTATAQ